MRPKKAEGDVKSIVLQIRVTEAEAAQIRAQAQIRKMGLGPYIRLLLLEDAEKLLADGKLRRNETGDWEIYSLGLWQKP